METLEAQARERLGEVIGGKWRLESVLGVGGMAAVYAAREPNGAIAAIKLLHAEMSVRREIRERFLREGYVANSIDHPGVVRALEHGASADDQVFLAMELLQGEPLSTRVRRHGSLPLHELLDYADQILDVLAVAHDRGIVHRDLKPDNLFVGADGRIKILDFGLARVHDSMPGDHRTRSGVALGTLPYMAPEQALGRRSEIDGRVDIFALGATMFRILSGRKVHEAESEAELLIAMASRPAPPLSSIAPRLPLDVCAVVDLALAFQRDARYPDARTMQADIRALRSGQRPTYALSRIATLSEPTRVDRPAPSVPASAPQGFATTYGGGAPPPSYGAPPASYGAAPQQVHAQTHGGATQSLQPATAASAAGSKASGAFPIVAWLLLGGFFFVLGVAGVVAYFYLFAADGSEPNATAATPTATTPTAAPNSSDPVAPTAQDTVNPTSTATPGAAPTTPGAATVSPKSEARSGLAPSTAATPAPEAASSAATAATTAEGALAASAPPPTAASPEAPAAASPPAPAPPPPAPPASQAAPPPAAPAPAGKSAPDKAASAKKPRGRRDK